MLPVGSDKVLVLTVQPQWQDDITLSVAELANLQPIVGNEDQGICVLLDSPRLSDLIVVVELLCTDDWAAQVLG